MFGSTPITVPEGFLPVVLAALMDDQSRVLTASRPQGKVMSGWWEFPGGKIEAGETSGGALCRELQEELAISVSVEALTPLAFAEEKRDGRTFLLLLYLCRRWHGDPVSVEGQKLAWREVSELHRPWADGGVMLKSNARLIEGLQRSMG